MSNNLHMNQFARSLRRLLFLPLFFLSFVGKAQTLIAGWDFQTTTNGGTAAVGSPNTPTAFIANFGSGNLYLNGTYGSSTWVTATSGNELNSFSGANINLGSGFSSVTTGAACLAVANSNANSKKIVFTIDMTNYIDLVISYATRTSGASGFTTQLWEYSTNGTSWNTIQSVSGLSTTFTTQTLSTVTGLDHISTAYIRVTFSGATATTSNNRLDNIQFNATLSSSAPVVTSNSSSGSVGNSFSYFINATNSPTSYSSGTLPLGLNLNTSTGEIYGTPISSFSGNIAISASNGSGTGNGTLNLTIAPSSQSITFNSLNNAIYGDGPLTLNATASSGLTVTYTSSNVNVASISGTTLTIVGAGTATITASQAGNSNFAAATDVSQSFTVNPKQLTVSGIVAQSKSYDGTTVAILDVTNASLSGIVNGDLIGLSGNGIFSTPNVGSGITVNGALTLTGANSSSYLLQQPSLTADISQASQTIVFGPLANVSVGSAPFTLMASGGGSGNSIVFTSNNPSVISISGNIATVVGPGSAVITASQAGDANYLSATPVSQTQTVVVQTLLAGWDFQTTSTGGTAVAAAPNCPLVLQSNFGNGTIYLNGTNGANTWVAANSGNQLSSFGGTSINAGSGFATTTTLGSLALINQTANGQGIVFAFSMAGRANLSVSYATQRSSTGFTTQEWQYSTDAQNWTSFQTVSSLQTSFALVTLNPISGLDNASTAYLRLIVNGCTASNANNRLDNIQLNANFVVNCSMSLTATASMVACYGGTTSVSVTPSNGIAPYSYQLNGGTAQSNGVFNNVTAGNYTVQVSDGNFCIATTSLVITEPAYVAVTASPVNGCQSVAYALDGSPAGGTFSIANPYTGPSTTYTYTYTDTNGCQYTSAPATISMSPCSLLDLKLFLQGYYVGSNEMAPVLINQGIGNDVSLVDDITVELRDITTFNLIQTTTAVLHTNGSALAAFSPVNGPYMVVIHHRNSIAVCSAQPIMLGSSIVSYDFSTAATQAYGDLQVEVEPGVWAFYTGDLNQDGFVDGFDFPEFDMDAQANVFGVYAASDFNGDGYVDPFDFPVFDINSYANVSSVLPTVITLPETFELGTKSTYTAGADALVSGSWNFTDAMIGTSTLDRKNGAKAARIQNSGLLTMNFDVLVDTPVVSVMHAKYGTDANSTWGLFYSTNGGNSWVQQGGTVTTSSTSLSATNFTVNYEGSIRFEIRKLSGGSARLNLDDFSISTSGSGSNTSTDNDHIAFGNPSNAITDVSFPNNYLVIKPQFDLAYNESRGTAAWVAWHFDINDRGTTPRCDCFATDVSLPSTFYRATATSYSGGGFDRGHMVPSAQRNNNITNNAVTFLMSNMLPQSPNLNQITWNNLEQYCVDLINNGYEIYTYSGGYGMGGTGSNGGVTNSLDNGNITVSSRNWKIIVVLTNGNNDVSRVDANTRIIAVDFPNNQTVNSQPWGYYRTSIDAIEAATGFDFLSVLPTALQTTIEAMVDNGPTN